MSDPARGHPRDPAPYPVPPEGLIDVDQLRRERDDALDALERIVRGASPALDGRRQIIGPDDIDLARACLRRAGRHP